MECSVCWPTFGAVAVATYFVLRFLWELIPVGRLTEKALFISGCDTGFGRSLALRCARAGMTVFAGCLTDEGAKGLAREAIDLPLKTFQLDVASDESVTAARRFVDSNIGSKKLWAVVTNAGILGCYGPADWCGPAEYQLSFDVNVLGVIRCTNAFLDLIKASHGRLISVSSICGRVATFGGAPYCVSKFGVEAYMDIMRREMRPFGVKCSLLEPGVFKATSILDAQAMDRRVDQVWKKMNASLKADYGEKFKKDCQCPEYF